MKRHRYRPPRPTLSERITLGRIRELNDAAMCAAANERRAIADGAARALTFLFLVPRA